MAPISIIRHQHHDGVLPSILSRSPHYNGLYTASVPRTPSKSHRFLDEPPSPSRFLQQKHQRGLWARPSQRHRDQRQGVDASPRKQLQTAFRLPTVVKTPPPQPQLRTRLPCTETSTPPTRSNGLHESSLKRVKSTSNLDKKCHTGSWSTLPTLRPSDSPQLLPDIDGISRISIHDHSGNDNIVEDTREEGTRSDTKTHLPLVSFKFGDQNDSYVGYTRDDEETDSVFYHEHFFSKDAAETQSFDKMLQCQSRIEKSRMLTAFSKTRISI